MEKQNIFSMHFKKLPSYLKPREKAKIYGVHHLTDIELLAIFLRSGTSKRDVLELSKDIITKFNGIQGLKHASLNELSSIYGIGGVKSLEINSLIEFSKRINLNKNKIINNYNDVAEIGKEMIKFDRNESFRSLQTYSE